MAQTRYWSTQFWHANAWHADYWRDALYPEQFPYWHPDYWRAPEYWEPNWWSIGTGQSDRIGQFVPTTDITASLVGTFAQSVARTGNLSTTTDTLGTFGGTVYQVQYVEWTINLGPAWSFFDIPAFNGEFDATLEDVAGPFIGFTVPPDSFIGRHESALEDFTSSTIGTFVPAPARTGAMVRTLPDDVGLFVGVFLFDEREGIFDATVDSVAGLLGGFVAFPGKIGPFFSTLEDTTGQFLGSAGPPLFGGTFAPTLDDVEAMWFASATPPGAILGEFIVTIPIGTMEAFGTFTRSENIHNADLVLLPLNGQLELLPLHVTLEWTLRE